MPPDEDGPEARPTEEGPEGIKEDDPEVRTDQEKQPVMQTSYYNSSVAKVFAQQRRTREPGAAEAFAAKREANLDLMLRLMGIRKRKPKP